MDTVVELAQRKAENLQAKMAEVNEERKLVRRVPTLPEVAGWVEQAKIAASGGELLIRRLPQRRSCSLLGAPLGPMSRPWLGPPRPYQVRTARRCEDFARAVDGTMLALARH